MQEEPEPKPVPVPTPVPVPVPEPVPTPVQWYAHSQASALTNFLPVLRLYLPYSNPLYNRLQAPHNLPSRHCLFASTIPTGTSPIPPLPEITTFLFADRSRHAESQIWLFNSLTSRKNPLSPSEAAVLREHVLSAIIFLKETQVPAAPGWPFQPRLRFAILHETLVPGLLEICAPLNAVLYSTTWNTWLVETSAISSAVKKRRVLPEGFSLGRVPESQLDLVISTSSVPRQAATLLLLPSVGVLDAEGRLVAWGYIGIDGSFATLYVIPEQRGHGLASFVAVELLTTLGNGGFQDLGFDGKSGWVHSDVYAGNLGSEGVMKSLGAEILWESTYIHIDSDLF